MTITLLSYEQYFNLNVFISKQDTSLVAQKGWLNY